MKLRTFTNEETLEILNDMDRLWELSSLITAATRLRIQEGFDSHIRDFKWSILRPFTKPVKSFEDMTYKISGGQFRTTVNGFLIKKGFTEFLSCWLGDSSAGYAFTQPLYTKLVETASDIGYWKHSDLAFFHMILERYAEKPFQPDQNDIKQIQWVQNRVKVLEKVWESYQNAI